LNANLHTTSHTTHREISKALDPKRVFFFEITVLEEEGIGYCSELIIQEPLTKLPKVQILIK
jgi:hypothetical protein